MNDNSAALLLQRMSEAVAHATSFPVWPQGEAPGAAASSVSFTLEEQYTGNSALDRTVTGVRSPQIVVYAPQNPNGIGLLVVPGGGYRRVVLDKEGSALAPAFNDAGYTLFVMTHRLPADGHQEGADAPLADLQRALRCLRARAHEWHLDAQKIGVLGFSAGGHAAASLGTRYHQHVYPPLDNIDSYSARPDFMALAYPVISMSDALTHAGSRQALLGEQPDASQLTQYSPDCCVDANTPPTFLFHAIDDPVVKVDNSVAMFNALRAHRVPVEMHLFEEGGHGFGIRDALPLPASAWPQLLMRWVERTLAKRDATSVR